MTLRVVLADDSYLVREAIAHVLADVPEVELAAVCSDVDELRRAIEAERPDVVVTDIRMPPTGDDEGLRVAAELRDSHPEMGVVVLSQYLEPRYALDLLAEGSDGRAYLLKERVHDEAELTAAIEATAAGGSVIDAKVVDMLVTVRARVAASPLAGLTPRERAILGEIAQGKSNAAIARSLTLSKRAVEKHINSLFTKLELPESEDVSRRVRAALLFLADEAGDSPALSGASEVPRRRQRIAALGQEQQRRLDAARDVGRPGEVELHEDRVDVLLDRALGEHERLGDRLVALALRDLGQRLALARREHGERRVGAVRPALHEQLDDLRVDVRAALLHGAHGVDQLPAVVDTLLEQVGAPRGAGLEQLEHVGGLGVLAEHHDTGLRVRVAQARRRRGCPRRCRSAASGCR